MDALEEVPVPAISPERFRALVADRYEEVDEAIATARELLSGRVVWHVNSTARGGGVAELLQSLLAYARGAGVDVRWMTISGNPDFFRVTKRIHNRLHESEGDGGPLGPAERGSTTPRCARPPTSSSSSFGPGTSSTSTTLSRPASCRTSSPPT